MLLKMVLGGVKGQNSTQNEFTQHFQHWILMKHSGMVCDNEE